MSKPWKKPPLVYLEWLDAFSTDFWTLPRDIETDKKCATAGFLIREGNGHITIAATMSEDGDCCTVMSIPLKMVTKKIRLKSPKGLK